MNRFALYLRSTVFGVSDSLVSTVGLLAGIDVAGASHRTIALTGIIYAFVEAFSMAVGDYLSEESAEEYATKRDVPSGAPAAAAGVMFVAFVLAAFIPLAPYLFLNDWSALALSIVASILALFVVGLISARLARLPVLARALRMALLGGAAIVIGVAIGLVVPVV